MHRYEGVKKLSAILDKAEGSEVVGRVIVVDSDGDQVLIESKKIETGISLDAAKERYSEDQESEILSVKMKSSCDYVSLTIADAKALRDALDSMIGYFESEEAGE